MKRPHRVWMFLAVVVLLSSNRPAAARVAFQAALLPSTIKVFPDGGIPSDAKERLTLTAARNEFAPFQVVVSAGKANLDSVRVAVSDLSGPGGVIHASRDLKFLVENVTIIEPSMTSTRKVWPDPLPPYKDFSVARKTAKAVWVDLFTPQDARSGLYEGDVTVATLKGEKKLKIRVDVRDVAIPVAPTIKTAFGIGYGGINAAHKVAPKSAEALTLGDAYYWFLIEHRITPYYPPVDFFDDAIHKYLDDPRVDFLRAPYSDDPVKMKKIADRIESNGWINKANFYVRDEPSIDEMKNVNRIGKNIHAANPRLRYLITTAPVGGLDSKEIQIWCPVIQFTLDPVRMNLLRKDMKNPGKEFWWYTCIGPKWDGTTYFIDELALAPRMHPWMNSLYGVTGILYWQTTHWGDVGDNPWEKTMTYPGGNGDGSLLYPGSRVSYNGPVASQRLKMLREGMEEYELLNILAGKLKEAATRIGAAAADYDPKSRLFEHAYALILPEGRMSAMGKNAPYQMYVTKDYRVLDEEREKVFQEIEEATKSPLLLVTTDPIDHAIVKKDSAKVSGFVESGAVVFVNGESVAVQDKAFSTTVPLKVGINEIRFEVRKDDNIKSVVRTIERR